MRRSSLLLCFLLSFLAVAQERRPNGFDRLLREVGLNVYFANLHSHHFMGRGHPSQHPCDLTGEFAFDDGRPCRNDPNGQKTKIEKETFIEYFVEACEYARTSGKLDILFVTPHTKTGTETTTETPLADFTERHRKISELNEGYGGKFLCGLGQEASSISAGNHLGVLGHLPGKRGTPTKPIYFPQGKFDVAYRDVAERTKRGEKVILQFNHPDVRQDFFGRSPLSPSPARANAMFNDYGIDDFPPMSTTLPRTMDRAVLESTYENMRVAAGDRFRLLELVRPERSTKSASDKFNVVRSRIKTAGHASFDTEMYDYVFYLNMGFRLAPTANQDNHYMNWGSATSARTGVVAKSLAEADVIQALDDRRTFASEDMNARALTLVRTKEGRALMGDVVETRSDSLKLTIGYDDPDAADAVGGLRVFFYRAKEALDFSDPRNPFLVQRLLEFRGANGDLPNGPPKDPSYDLPVGAKDPQLRAGQPRVFTVPLELGEQYFYVQLTQADKDRIWTAPIWVRRLP